MHRRTKDRAPRNRASFKSRVHRYLHFLQFLEEIGASCRPASLMTGSLGKVLQQHLLQSGTPRSELPKAKGLSVEDRDPRWGSIQLRQSEEEVRPIFWLLSCQNKTISPESEWFEPVPLT